MHESISPNPAKAQDKPSLDVQGGLKANRGELTAKFICDNNFLGIEKEKEDTRKSI